MPPFRNIENFNSQIIKNKSIEYEEDKNINNQSISHNENILKEKLTLEIRKTRKSSFKILPTTIYPKDYEVLSFRTRIKYDQRIFIQFLKNFYSDIMFCFQFLPIPYFSQLKLNY